MHANATVIDSAIDDDIVGTSPMRAIWSDQTRIQRYLDIERALCVTQGRLGVIPTEAADEIAAHCDVREMDFTRLTPLTRHAGYPVRPVIEQLTALCKDGLGQWCHWGATTQDITDTATVLQLRDALALVEQDLEAVRALLAGLARRYRDTPMVGRSSLPPAVPMTFGYKAAMSLAGLDRQRERLAQLRPRVLMGEFGGAVGALASVGAQGLPVQQGLMDALGLAQPPVSWHTARDTIAEVGCFLALVCGSLEQIATDVTPLLRTDRHAVQECGGRGASGPPMPQRQHHTPIAHAAIMACGRVVRQHAAALLGAMNADPERATGTWEIEWLALPATCCYAAGALAQARDMLGGLIVRPDHRRTDSKPTDGLANNDLGSSGAMIDPVLAGPAH